jgi:hypothetical protein
LFGHSNWPPRVASKKASTDDATRLAVGGANCANSRRRAADGHDKVGRTGDDDGGDLAAGGPRRAARRGKTMKKGARKAEGPTTGTSFLLLPRLMKLIFKLVFSPSRQPASAPARSDSSPAPLRAGASATRIGLDSELCRRLANWICKLQNCFVCKCAAKTMRGEGGAARASGGQD